MRKQREHNCIYPLAWALILCLLTALCLSPAMAIDEIVQQPTSLTVEYHPGGQNGDGATMRLYRVADMTGFGTFTPSGKFAQLPYELNGLKDEQWDVVAYQIKSYADSNKITASAVQTVKDGKAVFQNLNCGLYLLTSDMYMRGRKCYITKPTLVCLPNRSDPSHPDQWVYNVTMSPKPDTLNSDLLKIRKIWRNTTASDNLPPVTIHLIVNGQIHDTVTLGPDNNWSATFDNALPSGADWSVVEINVPTGYTASWSWDTDGQYIWINMVNTKNGTPNPPPPVLPQTGQLWWPVPVLAVSGMLLFGIGWRRRRQS